MLRNTIISLDYTSNRIKKKKREKWEVTASSKSSNEIKLWWFNSRGSRSLQRGFLEKECSAVPHKAIREADSLAKARIFKQEPWLDRWKFSTCTLMMVQPHSLIARLLCRICFRLRPHSNNSFINFSKKKKKLFFQNAKKKRLCYFIFLLNGYLGALFPLAIRQGSKF